MQSVVQRLETATKDSRLVEEYRDLVEEGRQQFRREIAALLPDTSPDGISVREGIIYNLPVLFPTSDLTKTVTRGLTVVLQYCFT